MTYFTTQIDRKAYGVPQSSFLESQTAAGEESDEQETEGTASAVLSKLTKFIYNCQTSEQSRLAHCTLILANVAFCTAVYVKLMLSLS